MSVAAIAQVTAGKVSHARIALGGVAPRPWRSTAAEQALVGNALDASTASRTAEAAINGAQPLDQNGYKVPLLAAIVEEAISGLWS